MKERKPEKGVKDADFEMTQVERNIQLEQVFKRMLPDVGDHIGKQVMAHLILVLKLEGIVGKNLTTEDINLVKDLKDKLVANPTLRNDLLKTIKTIQKG